MAQKDDSQNPKQLEKIESTLSKAELYIENNQKKLTYIVGGIIIVVALFMVFKNFYSKPREAKAQAVIWQAENYFKVDSFHIALYGNDAIIGFAEIVDDFGSTKTGNLAKYYAGICCLHLGEFDNAISYLKGFSTKDPLVGPLAISAMADAYSELNQYDKAVTLYMEAAKKSNHELTSPKFLMKAGLTYEKLGDSKNAVAAYQQIKDKYDASQEAATIDKFIIRASSIK